MIRLISIALLVLLALSAAQAPNFQERRLYYNEDDNCCVEDSDQVMLVITFNDRQMIQEGIDGETYCNNWSFLYEYKITPGESMCYTECYDIDEPWIHCDNLCFRQEVTYHRVLGKITAIVQNATAKSPAKFDNNLYNCRVKGDGTVQHYGPRGSIPYPRLDAYCERIPAENLRTESS